jgi:flavin-dependent dehydrogenase
MKVIVVGGGPAGMVAAITAKEAGNEVILLEKMNSLR